jgi:hypothetical protein
VYRRRDESGDILIRREIKQRQLTDIARVTYPWAAISKTGSAARFVSTPIRRIFSACCANAVRGNRPHAAN